MTPPINIDGTQITGASIDGQDVTEITVDGTQVFGDPGLLHQFESDTLSLNDGDPVSSWNNQVSGAPDLSSGADSPTFKTSQFNGNPVVRFDGADDRLLTSITNLTQPLQIWLVMQYQSTAGFAFDGGNANENTLLQGGGNFGTFDGNGNFVAGPGADTNQHLIDIKATSSNIELTVHNSGSGSSGNGGQTLTGLSLGSDGAGADNSNIDVVALEVYDTSVGGYNETDVRDSLFNEYGNGSSV